MKKYFNLNLLLTALPVILLLILTIYLAVLRYTLPEVKVHISGFDPRHLLAGHYIAYEIDWSKTDCTQFDNNKCPKIDFRQAADENYWGAYHRFYIPEQYARELDTAFRNKEKENNVFEVVFGYAPGFLPQAKKLLINGEDWRSYIKNNRK